MKNIFKQLFLVALYATAANATHEVTVSITNHSENAVDAMLKERTHIKPNDSITFLWKFENQDLISLVRSYSLCKSQYKYAINVRTAVPENKHYIYYAELFDISYPEFTQLILGLPLAANEKLAVVINKAGTITPGTLVNKKVVNSGFNSVPLTNAPAPEPQEAAKERGKELGETGSSKQRRLLEFEILAVLRK